MNLTDTAFIELLSARTLTVQVESKAALDSLRIMLYRKLLAHIEQWDAIGYLSDDLLDTTISVALDKKSKVATLSLVKRKPKLRFKILSIEGTPDHEAVPTNLEYNQEGQIQHRSSNPSSQEQGTDIDPSSPQGESNGQCGTEEDWSAQLRKFIESDSPAQD